jgi:polysaccharide export outer membrane protein
MTRSGHHIAWYLPVAAVLLMGGCNITSYFDPSKTGRFESTPTTIPILDRIDVIEREPDPWSNASAVTQDDLRPSDLTYRLSAGDVITVEIFELMVQGEVWTATRRIDASGTFRLPAPLGDIRAAGLTTQEFQDEVTRVVDERVMRSPIVNVLVEQGAAFSYTVYGAVASTGIYTLLRADHRLLDALAMAGGVALATQKVYVIRQVPLSQDVIFEPARRPPPDTPAPREETPANIEDLIDELDEPSASPPGTPPVDVDELTDEASEDPGGHIAPGAMYQESGPPIDIDQLEPIRVPTRPETQPAPPVDRATKTTGAAAAPPTVPPTPAPEVTYIYVPERDEWVPVRSEAPPEPVADDPPEAAPPAQLFVERIIEIPYARLKQGDSAYNIVIRPKDRIYIAEPRNGVSYIDGEIARPGVYSLPLNGKITLSRLVAAAGGLGGLAIPERVDLTRIVADNREATIRMNLGAIRRKTMPDLYLKPDDHIIIGTDFWALPLAVFRNGLRITYGFGFLLDRNFGNDVFGAPPTNIGVR